MRIELNDKPITCADGLSVAALLAQFELDKPGIALAINQTILPREAWAAHILQDGDAILLFQVIAGG